MDFWVQGQPGLQSEFQDSQGYTEKPCLKKKKKKKKNPREPLIYFQHNDIDHVSSGCGLSTHIPHNI